MSSLTSSTAAWPCERTSNILTTFHNLLYMSLPAMFSCIRISILDLTGSKFTKRSRSLSTMETAYSECWQRISCTSLSATLLHCTNRSNTDFRRVLFLSVSDISRGSRNARLFASGYWMADLFSSLATTVFRKFQQDRRKSRSCLSDTFFLTAFTAFSVVNAMSTLE